MDLHNVFSFNKKSTSIHYITKLFYLKMDLKIQKKKFIDLH